MKKSMFIILLCMLCLLNSCLLMLNGPQHRRVAITSNPPGADVYRNEKKTSKTTPCRIRAHKKTCSITLVKEGYEDYTFYSKRSSGAKLYAYIFPLIFFPIDLLTGSVYGFSPYKENATLTKVSSLQYDEIYNCTKKHKIEAPNLLACKRILILVDTLNHPLKNTLDFRGDIKIAGIKNTYGANTIITTDEILTNYDNRGKRYYTWNLPYFTELRATENSTGKETILKVENTKRQKLKLPNNSSLTLSIKADYFYGRNNVVSQDGLKCMSLNFYVNDRIVTITIGAYELSQKQRDSIVAKENERIRIENELQAYLRLSPIDKLQQNMVLYKIIPPLFSDDYNESKSITPIGGESMSMVGNVNFLVWGRIKNIFPVDTTVMISCSDKTQLLGAQYDNTPSEPVYLRLKANATQDFACVIPRYSRVGVINILWRFESTEEIDETSVSFNIDFVPTPVESYIRQELELINRAINNKPFKCQKMIYQSSGGNQLTLNEGRKRVASFNESVWEQMNWIEDHENSIQDQVFSEKVVSAESNGTVYEIVFKDRKKGRVKYIDNDDEWCLDYDMVFGWSRCINGKGKAIATLKWDLDN
jgi:hypothetical protein